MSIGKTKQYDPKEFSRVLLDNGFKFNRCKGSHMIYVRGNDIAVIPSRNANKMMCRRYIKQFNLSF